MRASILLLAVAGACRPSPGEGAKAGAAAASAAATASEAQSASAPPSASNPPNAAARAPAIRSFFVTPSDGGLQPVVDAIASARKSIRMMMFHLTVPEVESALLAARARGVDVRVILDGKTLEKPSSAAIAQRLIDHGIEVTRSSPAFSIMHVKALVIDEARAAIMSLNLTRSFEHTRDYAVITDDRGVVDELLRVFDADVQNAANRTKTTPPLTDPSLVWSPVDAESRLVALVDSAHQTIVASSENLGDKALGEAFVRATARGVNVRLLVPLCDEGSDPLRNVKFVRELDRKGVDARVMPPPASHDQPYIHAKMMIVDEARTFVGSINFSENSMRHARELGLVFADHSATRAFLNTFESDWRFAAPPPGEHETSHDLCRGGAGSSLGP